MLLAALFTLSLSARAADEPGLRLAPEARLRYVRSGPRLEEGAVWYQGRSSAAWATPTAEFQPQDAEFELRVEGGAGRVRPLQGRVLASATTTLADAGRWWEDAYVPSSTAPLRAGSLARIESLEGSAWLETPRGRHEAQAGDVLRLGHQLLMDEGRAVLSFGSGLWAVADASAALQTSSSGERPVYGLRRGRLRVHAPAVAEGGLPALLATANSTAELAGGDFEVSVSSSGLADYLPLAGSLRLEASGGRLKLAPPEAWWLPKE